MSEIKITCFAYDKNKNKCKALKCLYCNTQKGLECTFYKHKDTVNSSEIEKDIRHYSPDIKKEYEKIEEEEA